MSLQSVELLEASLPHSFSVSLIMQQSPSQNPWIETYWDAIGLLVEKRERAEHKPAVELIREQADIRRYLYRGFTLRLHTDECESYYHNLLAPSPCCYVVVTAASDGSPQPLLVTLSFDEAHAYLEGEDDLYTVPMPPEIYQWTEAFVLAHYVPVKRAKRKRQDWRHRDESTPS
jgi:hypothetical protein